MLLPGIALNFGSPRSKIRVKVGQIEVTAIGTLLLLILQIQIPTLFGGIQPLKVMV